MKSTVGAPVTYIVVMSCMEFKINDVFVIYKHGLFSRESQCIYKLGGVPVAITMQYSFPRGRDERDSTH